VSRQSGEGLADWIVPARTALLIIDMQVDFAAPDGALARAGVDMSSIPAALAAARRLATSARMAGAPVIFVGLRTSPETDSRAWAERTRRLGLDPGLTLCRGGERGSQFHGPTPQPDEIVIAKTRYSAFGEDDLKAALSARGVDTLVVCGLTTECCVDCTVRDAFQLDYHVFLVADACAAYANELHASSLEILALNCAIVVSSEAVIEAWVSPK
jgi:ureidoacrylate peracid hydrolase